MALISPSWVQTNPSYVVPDILMQYSQTSGAFDALAGSDPMVRLSEGDLMVYVKRIDIRTKIAAGQSAYNQLPSVDMNLQMLSTPTHLLRVRAEYDHHDMNASARWGVPLQEAYRLGMYQAHFQMSRDALLYGFMPEKGEGLLNVAEATRVSLPADENGNATTPLYSANSMLSFLLTQIQQIKQRTFQLGQGRRIVVLGPQRVLGPLEYGKIVQLTSYQRQGAGSLTVKGSIAEVLGMNDDMLEWRYDDTLIGKGAGGTDAIIIAMPELNKPKVQNRFNTNEFAELEPGLTANTMMFTDMVRPREITSPLPAGRVDVVTEMRITSGWALRPEALTIASMAYN